MIPGENCVALIWSLMNILLLLVQIVEDVRY